MSEHTPTPWTSRLYDSQVVIYGTGQIQIVKTSWHASIRAVYPLKPESLANAAFIVKAVNSHADLVKALEQIAGLVDSEAGEPLDDAIRIASNALRALVEGARKP